MARKDESRSKNQGAATRRILSTLEDYPICDLDDLISLCPDLTWNEVFMGLLRLSHTRRIRLSIQGIGRCKIHLLPRKSFHQPSILTGKQVPPADLSI